VRAALACDRTSLVAGAHPRVARYPGEDRRPSRLLHRGRARRSYLLQGHRYSGHCSVSPREGPEWSQGSARYLENPRAAAAVTMPSLDTNADTWTPVSFIRSYSLRTNTSLSIYVVVVVDMGQCLPTDRERDAHHSRWYVTLDQSINRRGRYLDSLSSPMDCLMGCSVQVA